MKDINDFHKGGDKIPLFTPLKVYIDIVLCLQGGEEEEEDITR